MPNKGYGYITQKIHLSKSQLDYSLLDHMRQGWEIMYYWEVPTPTVSVKDAYCETIIHVVPLANIGFTPGYEPFFEIGLIKWNDPPAEPEKPCSRCNFPFPNPDRIDREA